MDRSEQPVLALRRDELRLFPRPRRPLAMGRDELDVDERHALWYRGAHLREPGGLGPGERPRIAVRGVLVDRPERQLVALRRVFAGMGRSERPLALGRGELDLDERVPEPVSTGRLRRHWGPCVYQYSRRTLRSCLLEGRAGPFPALGGRRHRLHWRIRDAPGPLGVRAAGLHAPVCGYDRAGFDPRGERDAGGLGPRLRRGSDVRVDDRGRRDRLRPGHSGPFVHGDTWRDERRPQRHGPKERVRGQLEKGDSDRRLPPARGRPERNGKRHRRSRNDGLLPA